MKILIFFTTLLFSILSLAQNTVGNGGDVIASEFNSIARTAVYFLKSKSLTAIEKNIVKNIEVKMDTTMLVSVSEKLILNGREVDAINYPIENKILISKNRWEQIRLRNPAERALIVLHEYIWITGVNDQNYNFSTSLVNKVKANLNENSIATEKYQVLISEFYMDLLIFRSDLLEMQQQQKADYAKYCLSVGSLKSQVENIIQHTQENLFWFSQKTQEKVSRAMEGLKESSKNRASVCLEQRQIEYLQQLKSINETAAMLKFLMEATGFPESSL